MAFQSLYISEFPEDPINPFGTRLFQKVYLKNYKQKLLATALVSKYQDVCPLHLIFQYGHPSQVLTRLNVAELWWSDENWCFQCDIGHSLLLGYCQMEKLIVPAQATYLVSLNIWPVCCNLDKIFTRTTEYGWRATLYKKWRNQPHLGRRSSPIIK